MRMRCVTERIEWQRQSVAKTWYNRFVIPRVCRMANPGYCKRVVCRVSIPRCGVTVLPYCDVV
eukprot:9678464-Lingulodinium_polyedra.AAC.1